jgi:hypothetical protein
VAKPSTATISPHELIPHGISGLCIHSSDFCQVQTKHRHVALCRFKNVPIRYPTPKNNVATMIPDGLKTGGTISGNLHGTGRQDASWAKYERGGWISASIHESKIDRERQWKILPREALDRAARWSGSAVLKFGTELESSVARRGGIIGNRHYRQPLLERHKGPLYRLKRIAVNRNGVLRGLSQGLQFLDLIESGCGLSLRGTSESLHTLRLNYSGVGLFTGSNSEIMGIRSATFHLAQLSTHNAPLQKADNHQPERQGYYSASEPNHPPLGAFYTVLFGLNFSLHAIGGYVLCCWVELNLWKRWRNNRLRRRDWFYSLFLYIFAGIVIWHGFIVLQKLLDGPVLM